MGGVDRSADFRRESRAGRRVTAALLVVIAVLMIITGWLASAVLSPQVSAATPAPAAREAGVSIEVRIPAQQAFADSAGAHRRELFEQRRQRFADNGPLTRQTDQPPEMLTAAPNN